MNLSDLRKMSVDDRLKLVNLIEGMPQLVQTCVKININDPCMNPSFYKGRERRISEFSTIRKYINSRQYDVLKSDSAISSYYQSDYCRIYEKISNNRTIPIGIKNVLINILSSSSYDYSSDRKSVV